MTLRNQIYILTIIFLIGCHSADYYLQQGHNIGLTGNYKSAIQLFDKAIQKNPKLKEAYVQRGLCYEYSNQIDSAISSYKTLLSFDPKNTTAFYYIGLCKYKQIQFASSVEFYNNALMTKGDSNPTDTSGTPAIFMELNKDGPLGNLEPFDVPAYDIFFKRGLAFYSGGQIKKAYYDFKSCIQQNYYLGQSYYMVGLCWLAANKKDSACTAFKQGSYYGDSLATRKLNEVCK